MSDSPVVDQFIKDIEVGIIPDWITDHLRVYRESGGKEGHMYDASGIDKRCGIVPALLLTTVGRKSGQKRTMPVFYGKVDGNYIVIGTKGGADTHAKWYLNLLANPVAEIQAGTEKFTARARTAEGVEREKLWKHMLTVYPPYADYQAKTKRVVPIIVLERQGK